MSGSRRALAAARGCFAVALASAAILTQPVTIAAAGADHTTVTVRVYQTDDLPFPIERALAEAGMLMQGALVDVHWERCGVGFSSAACVTLPQSSELFLRITGGGGDRQERQVRLGEALVSPCAGGVLATVYVDRVAMLAAETETDVAVLLGRVAAHELGHLMMHTSVHHARRGLMRPNWTRQELRRNLAADWMFTPEDVATFRR